MSSARSASRAWRSARARCSSSGSRSAASRRSPRRPRSLGTLGLLLFLYGIGIQYGDQFFKGLTSVDGLKANIAAALGVIASGFLAIAFVPLFGVKLDESLGLFAGSGTSTASLQAAMAAMKSDGATVGYSVAYPFGVAGPILFLYVLSALLKPHIERPPPKLIETAEIALRNPEFIGSRLSDLKTRMPAGIAIAAVRREHHNRRPPTISSCKPTTSCLRPPPIPPRCNEPYRSSASCSRGA